MVEKNSMQGLNEALAKIGAALDPLDDESKQLVLRWAAEYFGVPVDAGKKTNLHGSRDEHEVEGGQFTEIAELFVSANPKLQAEKAMVVAYWIQVVQGNAYFTGYQINSQLKDLGHGVGNITAVFNGLIRRKPQCVIQVKKSGTSRQARKSYKLTQAGINAVERLLKVGAEEN